MHGYYECKKSSLELNLIIISKFVFLQTLPLTSNLLKPDMSSICVVLLKCHQKIDYIIDQKTRRENNLLRQSQFLKKKSHVNFSSSLFKLLFFLQSGETSQRGICYQQGYSVQFVFRVIICTTFGYKIYYLKAYPCKAVDKFHVWA